MFSETAKDSRFDKISFVFLILIDTRNRIIYINKAQLNTLYAGTTFSKDDSHSNALLSVNIELGRSFIIFQLNTDLIYSDKVSTYSRFAKVEIHDYF